jgi:hypothetical protein
MAQLACNGCDYKNRYMGLLEGLVTLFRITMNLVARALYIAVSMNEISIRLDRASIMNSMCIRPYMYQ